VKFHAQPLRRLFQYAIIGAVGQIAIYKGGGNMHPNFWLIMVCAVVAIGTGVIASKKKK
jgi:hypothetical protein